MKFRTTAGTESGKRPGIARDFLQIVINLLLLTASSLLFALSFPSFASINGWFPLGFICLVPVFIVVRRSRWTGIAFYGAFFGLVSYLLLNDWLGKFHPLAIFIVPAIYLVYGLILFPALKAADSLFPKYGYLLQACIWLSYEYLRTRGFVGYSWGILGYSQYRFLPLVRFSSLAGIWGVTFLTVFPSVFLGNALKNGVKQFSGFVRRQYPAAVVFSVVFTGAVIYGLATEREFDSVRNWKVALVQQNIDPWHGETEAYRASLDILKRQSTAALTHDPDIVIWSETAFVPGIDWHTRFRSDPVRYALVKELREYLADMPVPFVFGNDDGQWERDRYGEYARVDYNATVLYEDGKLKQTYRKLHLVPFTEHFPYEKLLPGVYQWLKNADTHFWEKGTERTVFDASGVKFSTPICFEDTFGYLSREFVRAGAEVIVNVTNDSWSNSDVMMMQHLGMAVFRAAENRRSMVRSTNGGMTATIDPNGRITNMLEPLTEGYLIGTVPVYTGETTLYTLWGDWLAVVFIVVSSAGLLAGAGLRCIRIDNRHEV